MNSFLYKVVFENTILDYLITIGIILLVLILKPVLSRLVAGLISRMIIDKQQQGNRRLFRELVLPPIRLFVMVLTIIIAISRLKFPDILNFNIYKATFHSVIEAAARVVLIFSIIWLSNRVVAYIAALLHAKATETEDRSDDQLIVFFRDFFKVIIWIIGILMILKFSFGFAMSNVFTGLSLVGAALALAFRESLENLIASFIIFFDKPFTIGDVVKVQSITGTVEKIGLRSSRIRTTEKTFVTVPNKQMVDSILDNQSLRSQRNVILNLEIGLEANSEQLSIFINSVETLLLQKEIMDFNVFLSEIGKSVNVVHVEYFVPIEIGIKDFFKLREKNSLAILELLTKSGLNLASGKSSIVINNSTKE